MFLLQILLILRIPDRSLSGCGRLIPKIGQVTDAPKSGQSAGGGSAGAGGQSAGGQSGADGSEASAQGTGSQSGSGGENAGLSAELFTLPYDDPDPDEKASAYPWLCSDIVENVDKLGGLTETDDFHAAVNRDWLTSNEIPTGYYSYDTFAERQLEPEGLLPGRAGNVRHHLGHRQAV